MTEPVPCPLCKVPPTVTYKRSIAHPWTIRCNNEKCTNTLVSDRIVKLNAVKFWNKACGFLSRGEKVPVKKYAMTREEEEMDTSAGRCICGLLLPCYTCIGSVTDYMFTQVDFETKASIRR
ncbi:hypothetical protein UFOVP276_22 [uncultured Caudovirales phage]|uniref:Uncharacterized protein n=1 Tax=uncultured Caudovirales phage TaxID=2100421 RepID=A0A6J5LP43_9CAUD|nr:hypothetical protein UFOVP127_159 [uncultured Caudovirales phage]CAB4134860.1 hypothetical protein UFOVP276_22 [uncultured Caudovirales phage]